MAFNAKIASARASLTYIVDEIVTCGRALSRQNSHFFLQTYTRHDQMVIVHRPTCQPETTKKTEISGLRCFIPRSRGVSTRPGLVVTGVGFFYAKLSYRWRNRLQQFYRPTNPPKEPLAKQNHWRTRIIRDMDKNHFWHPWNVFKHLHNISSSRPTVNHEEWFAKVGTYRATYCI